jgi:hypothetical protein
MVFKSLYAEHLTVDLRVILEGLSSIDLKHYFVLIVEVCMSDP